MQAHPLANSPSVNMESYVRASHRRDLAINLDLLQRDWIIKLNLERYPPQPNVCCPKVIVSDRPGSGKNTRVELRLISTVTYQPVRTRPRAIASMTKITAKTNELPDERDTPVTENELDSLDPEAVSVEVDEDGWPIITSSAGDGSSVEDWRESEEATSEEKATSNEEEFNLDHRHFPAGLNPGKSHTYIHCKISGFAEWNGDFVTIFVGYQKIEFVVPTFLLSDNLKFFRAVFESERWFEGIENTVSLPEESPVDFMLLLRFLVHTLTKDFNQVYTRPLDLGRDQGALDEDACYPFWLSANPNRPNEEHEEDQTSITPWILRVVAMAERLCWSGSESRLTDVLDATLKPCRADRVAPALMDWLFEYSAKESVLRTYVYNRLLQSLLSGDVNPVVYKDYAEDDPELMQMLLNGSFEHPLALNQSMQPVLTTQCNSLPSGDLISAHSSLVGKCFELAWSLFVGLHGCIHERSLTCVKPEHVWDEVSGWSGCKGSCIGCWNKDLGGTREEIARVLLVE